jgi:GT2 family glycosyltransferase
MRTSVLVITSGRDAHLARVLAGLERSDPRPEQVVVVFMNQPDAVVPDTGLEVVVGEVRDPDRLPLAAARNHAASLAEGEVLVFLDVDCIPAAATVGRLAAEVARHPRSLVMGSPRYLRPDWLDRVGDAGTTMDAVPTEEDLVHHSVPHPARETLEPGPSRQWHLAWTLVLALGARQFTTVGGFDEGFRGYGAEDTDFAFRARDAGLGLRSSEAMVFHQHHGVHRPPLHHFRDIVLNARRFRQVHGRWAMEGWLTRFSSLGLVDWDPDGERLAILRAPTPEEIRASRDAGAAF